MSWARRTVVVRVAAVPAEVDEAFARGAAGVGIEWPAAVELAWVTTSTTTVGRLRKKERVVTVHGVLGPEVLAWAVQDDGGAPGAIVVRRDRVDVFAGTGLSPELMARVGETGGDGVTVRGDFGGRETSTYFMALGDGPDAERVRSALLA